MSKTNKYTRLKGANIMNKVNKIIIVMILLCNGYACQKLDRPDMVLIPDPESNSLKYYISFDYETATDSSIYSFPVTPVNITYTEGIRGDAMQGGNDRYVLIDTLPGLYHGINLKDSLVNINAFTISCWVYLTKSQIADGAVALFTIPDTKGNDWVGNLEIFFDGAVGDNVPVAMHIRNYRTGTLTDFWIAKDNTPGIFLNNVLDKWTHLVFRYSGKSSTVTYFRDGEKVLVKKYDTDFGTLAFKNVEKAVVGAFQNITIPKIAPNAQFQGWEKTFPGKIDQFRFYNSFLTDKEVKEMYNSKK